MQCNILHDRDEDENEYSRISQMVESLLMYSLGILTVIAHNTDEVLRTVQQNKALDPSNSF